jgi:hypothetical protein
LKGVSNIDLYEKKFEDKFDMRSWYIVRIEFVDGGHVIEFNLRNLSTLWGVLDGWDKLQYTLKVLNNLTQNKGQYYVLRNKDLTVTKGGNAFVVYVILKRSVFNVVV